MINYNKTNRKKELSRDKISISTDFIPNINEWIERTLTKDTFVNAFDEVVDILIKDPDLHLLPNCKVNEMCPAFHLTGLWVMSAICHAKDGLLINEDSIENKDQQFEFIINNCKIGLHKAKDYTCNVLKNKNKNNTPSTPSVILKDSSNSTCLCNIYALLEDFEMVDEYLPKQFISKETIINCPNIPEFFYEKALTEKLQDIFKNMKIDDLPYTLDLLDNMLDILNDNIYMLVSISDNLLQLEPTKSLN